MKSLLLVIVCLSVFLSASITYALQQVAGPLFFTVPLGGSSSARYGLVNDGEETITISLRAEGDAAKYLSFPSSVELQPKKMVYTEVTANIPENYDRASGGNIYGWMYALQQGAPGQVQINVQMKKNVTIVIPGVPFVERESTTIQTVQTLTTAQTTQAQSAITGSFVMTPANYLVAGAAIGFSIGIFFVVTKRRGG